MINSINFVPNGIILLTFNYSSQFILYNVYVCFKSIRLRKFCLALFAILIRNYEVCDYRQFLFVNLYNKRD